MGSSEIENDELDLYAVIKFDLVLFFIIDVSEVMKGSKIDAVNSAFMELIPEIKKISEENKEVQIKTAFLEFSSGIRWITKNGPVNIEMFQWNNLKTYGASDFGNACYALNDKLSVENFMKNLTSSFPPMIFLVSGSKPTDDWKEAIKELKQNEWLNGSPITAVAVGERADKDVLKEFTGNTKTVLKSIDNEKLKNLIYQYAHNLEMFVTKQLEERRKVSGA